MPEVRPTEAQLRYLRRGLAQPGRKLPLFDEDGQQIVAKTVRSCVRQGWAEPWFNNPIKRDWLVCRLTDSGLAAVTRKPAQRRHTQDQLGQNQPARRREPVHLEMV
jgi:hypothetical protein